MSFGQRLRDARKAKKLTQKQLGEQLGVPQSTVGGWERDEFQPSRGRVAALAKAVGLSLMEMQFGESDQPFLHEATADKPSRPQSPEWEVPMRGYVGAAASFKPFFDDFDESVRSPMEPTAQTEAVRVDGMSMLPAFPHGVLLFYSRRDLNVDRYLRRAAIVGLGDGEVLFKVLQKGDTPGLYRLCSLNPDFADINNVHVEWVLPIDHISF